MQRTGPPKMSHARSSYEERTTQQRKMRKQNTKTQAKGGGAKQLKRKVPNCQRRRNTDSAIRCARFGDGTEEKNTSQIEPKGHGSCHDPATREEGKAKISNYRSDRENQGRKDKLPD
jgi:hypothetical protein